jgi:hypothetical protein
MQRLHQAGRVGHSSQFDFLLYRQKLYRRAHAMKAFIVACLAAVALAAIGLAVLNHVQEPADQAFATPYARV